MAHSVLHFAVGLAAGTALFAHRAVRRLRRGAPLAAPLGRALVLAYALGGWAIVPNLLRRLGVPESVCREPWMNVFFFHPALDRIKAGGVLIGELAVILCFAVQYTVLLAAILLIRRRSARG